MARLLIVGASGFIGTALRRNLAGERHQVTCASRTPAPALPGETWRAMDLLQVPREGLAELVAEARPDALINCVGLAEAPADEMRNANTVLPGRLVEVLAGRTIRLVHLGSAAEYGDRTPGPPIQEEDPAQPRSAYGVTKLEGTLAVVDAARAGKMDAVVLRVFNPLGPGLPLASMPGVAAHRIREAIRSGKDSISMGRLDAWRDFVDVRDVADAMVAAATARTIANAILNVGSGHAHQARAVVLAMAQAAGWEGEVLEESGLGSNRSSGVSWQQASIERIGSDLGWHPRRLFEEAAASVLSGFEEASAQADAAATKER
jgi:nucleoside-diphosphate-sugar epimerase